jgi:hypothetical protein
MANLDLDIQADALSNSYTLAHLAKAAYADDPTSDDLYK